MRAFSVPVSFQSLVVVVQPAKDAAHPILFGVTRPSVAFQFKSLVPISVQGVGHPVQSVADVRSTDARRRERDGPEGVVQGFQVNLYKVEPSICVFACNLLSNDRCRLALLDEVVKGGPEMPLIIKPAAFTCRAERLARATSRPNGLIVGPSGLSQGVTPDANSGKEMALGVTNQLGRFDIFN